MFLFCLPEQYDLTSQCIRGIPPVQLWSDSNHEEGWDLDEAKRLQEATKTSQARLARPTRFPAAPHAQPLMVG